MIFGGGGIWGGPGGGRPPPCRRRRQPQRAAVAAAATPHSVTSLLVMKIQGELYHITRPEVGIWEKIYNID